MDGDILRNLEECVEGKVVEETLKTGLPQNVFNSVAAFLSENPRASMEKSSWTPKHEHFHNLVDVLNLCLAYSLRHSKEANRLYAPMLTHTFRVISAGNRISTSLEDALEQFNF